MEKNKNNVPNIYIGVDIGATGGVVVLKESGEVITHTIPAIKGKVVDIDLFRIFAEYSEYNMFIMLEDVHSLFGMSAKSNFSFGSTFGKKLMIGAICGHLYDAKLDLVAPKKWQAEVWSSVDKIYKTGKKIDTKKTSLMASKRLFPNETFLATKRSRVPHDGLVDAALIALYCKMKYSR